MHNYTGTISKTSSTTALTISSVEQDAGKEGTVSSAVTLASGFTKTGEGAITFTGTTGISVADVSAGALKFDGSLTTLNDTLTISGGVAENTATGDNTEIRLGTAGKVSIVSGSLINDGFTYSNNGADASITGNGQSTLKVYEGSVVLKDVAMEKTVSADKGIGIEMDNVSLIVNAGTTTLRKDGEGKTQSLSSVSVGNGATLKVENTKAAISNASGTGIISTTVAHTLSLNTESGKEFTGTLEASGENGVLSVNGVKELAALKVDGGQVWANTADSAISVSISEVVLAGGMVGVYSAVSVEATVQTGSLTVSGNSTLYANLDLAQDGTLTLNSSLTMGSTLTLNSGITLSGSLLTGWTDRSQALTLFSGVDELVLNGKTATADTTYDASSVFSGMSGYNLVMTDGTGGKDYIVQLVQSTPTPEPTTATLSLLALMGLAARRRRRKA
ncbi:MAG: MYXO-CTERM sorting domain-containing protein [Akkermansia muciniphila]|nr:MYXO-CTERM sorting domain-containing protein [Akkermansia muciniphila]